MYRRCLRRCACFAWLSCILRSLCRHDSAWFRLAGVGLRSVEEAEPFSDLAYTLGLLSMAVIHVDPVQETGEKHHRIALHSHDDLSPHSY